MDDEHQELVDTIFLSARDRASTRFEKITDDLIDPDSPLYERSLGATATYLDAFFNADDRDEPPTIVQRFIEATNAVRDDKEYDPLTRRRAIKLGQKIACASIQAARRAEARAS